MVSIEFISGFILRKMNDLFLTYLKTNVVSYKAHFTKNSTTWGSYLYKIGYWSKRLENLFLSNLLNVQSHQRKKYSALATQKITFQI